MLAQIKPQNDKKVLGLLDLGRIQLMLKIGVTEEERSVPQKIEIKIKADISNMLEFIKNDDISSTICYDTLLCKISDSIESKEYRLVETLALDINKLIKNQFPFIKNSVKVIKWPKVKNLTGSISFTVSDLENGK